MNRRSFITLLGSGIAVLCLPEVEWVPTAPTSTIDVPRTTTLTDIAEITTELLHQMTLRLPNLRGTFLPGVYRVGHEGMTQQYHIGLAAPDDGTGLDVRTCIIPGAGALVHAISDCRLERFGALPVDIECAQAAIATDERSGLAVRGIRAYDIGNIGQYAHLPPGWRYRFDVLGGRA